MAKQAGIIKVTGTVYNVSFYKLDKGYYARAKSSLTGERIKKDPAFKKTMHHAGLLAKASTIASSIYRKLLRDNRNRMLYQQLTGKAIKLLKQGLSEEDVLTAISGIAESFHKGIAKPLNKSDDRIIVEQPRMLKPGLSLAAVDRSGILRGLSLPSFACSDLFHPIAPLFSQFACIRATNGCPRKWLYSCFSRKGYMMEDFKFKVIFKK